MIGRRRFLHGAATLALSVALPPSLRGAPARAETHANGKLVPEPPRPLRHDVPYTPLDEIPNHRQYMREIVKVLATYGKARNPNFVTLVRNAPELLVKGLRESDWETGRDPEGAAAGKYSPVGSLIRPYLDAIDGLLIDGLFCGRDTVDKPSDDAMGKFLLQTAQRLQAEGRRALSIEYCRSPKLRAEAERKATAAKILSYIDTEAGKTLGRVPSGHPPRENSQHITKLASMRNFLPVMNSDAFASRGDWLRALDDTNFDMFILDPFWHGGESLTFADVRKLKFKELGSTRLVLALLPVGRAMESRYYWKKEWRAGSPAWLMGADPLVPAKRVVKYWDPEWKSIIGKYMQGLVDLGFDGVLLDDLDAYQYFEDLMPI